MSDMPEAFGPRHSAGAFRDLAIDLACARAPGTGVAAERSAQPHGTALARKIEAAVRNTFRGLFGEETWLSGSPCTDARMATFEISAVIGITGRRRGALVLRFPLGLAAALAARMLGDRPGSPVSDETLADCVGETASVIAGNALPLTAGPAEQRITVPSVVLGAHRVVWRRRDPPGETLLFQTSGGVFGAEIRLLDDGADQARSKKFLLVDDSRLMRMLLAKALHEAGFGDWQCLEAGDGQAAIEALAAANFEVDAVFCDLCMPGMDGLAFLDALRASGDLRRCPVIVVTGEASGERGREAIERGARGWVVKPFTPQTVRAAVVDAVGLMV